MAKSNKNNVGNTSSMLSGGILATGTSNSVFSIAKFHYEILGQKIESDSTYGDPTMAICIALINTLGISYYAELKKQHISFQGKIGEFLEEQLIAYCRDQKIEQVIE